MASLETPVLKLVAQCCQAVLQYTSKPKNIMKLYTSHLSIQNILDLNALTVLFAVPIVVPFVDVTLPVMQE